MTDRAATLCDLSLRLAQARIYVLRLGQTGVTARALRRSEELAREIAEMADEWAADLEASEELEASE